METTEAAFLIHSLGLLPHPEGGYYKEVYRSAESIQADALPLRYGGSRHFGTSIYFMLTSAAPSRFHRIKSDELWYFHTGGSLSLHILHQGAYRQTRIGSDVRAEEVFQVVIPAGAWFAAESDPEPGFSLVSCAVMPGFDFADFELAETLKLAAVYPEHQALIKRLS
jgi:uncharacterized protein